MGMYLQLFIASSIPVIKVVILCSVGGLAARKGLLTLEGRKVMGTMAYMVFGPALNFTTLASSLSPSRLVHWWPLIANMAISISVGLALGYAQAVVLKPPRWFQPHTVLACALGNVGNLPLVIVSTLAESSAAILHNIDPDQAASLAISYVVVALLVAATVHATLGYYMLAPDPRYPGPDQPQLLQLQKQQEQHLLPSGVYTPSDQLGDQPIVDASVAMRSAAGSSSGSALACEAASKDGSEGQCADIPGSAAQPFHQQDAGMNQQHSGLMNGHVQLVVDGDSDQQAHPAATRSCVDLDLDRQLLASLNAAQMSADPSSAAAACQPGAKALMHSSHASSTQVLDLQPLLLQPPLPSHGCSDSTASPATAIQSSCSMGLAMLPGASDDRPTPASASTSASASQAHDARSGPSLHPSSSDPCSSASIAAGPAPSSMATMVRPGPGPVAEALEVEATSASSAPCGAGVAVSTATASGYSHSHGGIGGRSWLADDVDDERLGLLASSQGGAGRAGRAQASSSAGALATTREGTLRRVAWSSEQQIDRAGPGTGPGDEPGSQAPDTDMADLGPGSSSPSPSGFWRSGSSFVLTRLRSLRSPRRLLDRVHGFSFALPSRARPQLLLPLGSSGPSTTSLAGAGGASSRPSSFRAKDIAVIVLRESMSPPIVACLLSIPVGCIKPVQDAFFSPHGALRLVADCLVMLADCCIPVMMIVLGATLSNGPGVADVPLKTVVSIAVFRLLLLPLLMGGLVVGGYVAGAFHAPDPIFLLVLLIQNTCPTAINIHTMATVHQNGDRHVSAILFWQYLASIVTLPPYLSLYLLTVKHIMKDDSSVANSN